MKKYLLTLLLLVSGVASAQQFEHSWTEGDGPVAFSQAELDKFGQDTGRVEVTFIPSTLPVDSSQRIIEIPNRLTVRTYNNAVHGNWYDNGSNRLVRSRWGIVSAGVPIKIVFTWDTLGWAVLVDDVLRVHDWQALPNLAFPTAGVYGARPDGTQEATGTFVLKFFDAQAVYDPCSVDVVGTINQGVPLDNSGSWSAGVDPGCIAPPVVLDTVTLNWTLPITNTDDSTIPATGPTSLATTLIEYSPCNNGNVVNPKKVALIPIPAEVADIDIFDPGLFCFQAKVINVEGTSSIFSNVAEKTVNTNPPNPPTGLVVVTGVNLVYSLLQTEGRLAFLPEGEATPGTVCDTEIRVDAHYFPAGGPEVILTTYQVPNSEVSWFGTPVVKAVFASCF